MDRKEKMCGGGQIDEKRKMVWEKGKKEGVKRVGGQVDWKRREKCAREIRTLGRSNR